MVRHGRLFRSFSVLLIPKTFLFLPVMRNVQQSGNGTASNRLMNYGWLARKITKRLCSRCAAGRKHKMFSSKSLFAMVLVNCKLKKKFLRCVLVSTLQRLRRYSVPTHAEGVVISRLQAAEKQ